MIKYVAVYRPARPLKASRSCREKIAAARSGEKPTKISQLVIVWGEQFGVSNYQNVGSEFPPPPRPIPASA